MKCKRLVLLCGILLTTLLLVTCFSLITRTTPVQASIFEKIENGKSVNTPLTSSETPLSLQQQFRCDVAYAYTGKGNLSDVSKDSDGTQMNPLSRYPSAIYLNTTRISNTTRDASNVELEVYLVELVTEKGIAEKYTWFEGTNYDNSFSDINKVQSAVAAQLDKLIDSRTLTAQSGHFKFNWTAGASSFGGCLGTIGHYNSRPSGSGLWYSGEPMTVVLKISILGWISLKDDGVFVDVNNEKATMQINLQRFNDGFVYNRMTK
jgi:hypothetical protein